MRHGKHNLTFEKQFKSWHLHSDKSKKITSLFARGSDIKDLLCNAYVTIESDIGEETEGVYNLNDHDVDVVTEHLRTFINEVST